ncbi:MAG: hypothetical protein A2X28_02015 [Elusimicrobia bacterium GWA2_56_46]|nr:MAG: hypothetical protein A2X28_02015 [Elusimicrobia bacterium GWA2_56_46]OGR55454.1 MAG: hypothetical protein A2X39_00950 [Elusimicrobia bacterium GWC2_56_31]HBW21921.1 hypothetical protein [Elusimicrobiota bacterium]
MNKTETNGAALVDELKKTVAGIVGSGSHKAGVDGAWLSNSARLCQRILTSDPADFLKWDVISRTMVVGNAEFVPGELAFLQALPDWKSRWANAIKESSVGSPDMFGGFPSSSGNLIHLAYHLANFEQKTGARISESGFVLEFGGGYGSMCRLVHNLGFKGRYVIFDLPPLSALQRFFLKMNGISAVHPAKPFKAAPKDVICVSELEQLPEIFSDHVNLVDAAFIATWSLSEAPVGLRQSILPLVKQFKAFLVAYQGLFGEVDNAEFFKEWANAMKDVEWHRWKIAHLPNQRYKDNYYLMGKKRCSLIS